MYVAKGGQIVNSIIIHGIVSQKKRNYIIIIVKYITLYGERYHIFTEYNHSAPGIISQLLWIWSQCIRNNIMIYVNNITVKYDLYHMVEWNISRLNRKWSAFEWTISQPAMNMITFKGY